MELTPALACLTALAGFFAGALGALLGIGGGVLLVPILVLGVGLPVHLATGISLTSMIATSTAVSSSAATRPLINLRLGMLLEVATAAGGLIGGITAHLVTARGLARLYSLVMSLIAVVTLARLGRRNVLDASAETGTWGGRFFDEDTKEVVAYRVRRLPLALIGSFVAGQLSTLLGIGGATLKVPLLNGFCGVPIRVAAATSAMMIGVTAAAGAIVYYGQGLILPGFAAASALGIAAGSTAGLRLTTRWRVRHLKVLMALVLFLVAALMLATA